MQEMVQQFLERQRKSEQCDRREILLQLGLWEKEYGPGVGAAVSDYPQQDEKGRYRKAPILVTEAEWAELLPYVQQIQRKKDGKIASALQILGGISYLWGGWACLSWAYDSRFLPLLLGAVLGTLCLGAAQVLRRLK